MTQTVIPAAPHARLRNALMISCASAALAAVALAPQAARAQALPSGAFQGSITGTSGTVTRTPTTNTTETITIGSPTATINWSPTNQGPDGGTIDFLPSGNTATFTSAGGITDYTVLNRILPDSGQPIGLNGHVISTLQGTSATGGSVWFYSPNGIVVGASAVFDVGSLLLTTNDVTSFGTSANGFNATFSGPAGSTSAIQIQNGAQINALQQNSYVALVAPRIEQGGKVRVNGSAAYVAGEQLSMTMNQGLFDIQVDVGTSDSNGIVHTGETSGPANATAADNHTIYMVAVPKNNAVTMLLSGGTIGFDATSASVENGQIILSGGQSVSDTSFDNDWQGGAIGGPAAGITIAGGHYSSIVTARATGAVQASGDGGALTFDGDVNLQGLEAASLVASDGEAVTVHGNAHVSSDDLRFFDTADSTLGLDANGGSAGIRADSGGALTVDGSASVTANASPATNFETLTGGTSTGGSALIDANGGTITIGDAVEVSATGFGDGVSHSGIDGRESSGGLAAVSATSGGSLHIGGNLDIIAEGQGSSSALASGGTGGAGHGGTVTVSADDNGAISVGGLTTASASGIGGTLLASTDGTGGQGAGGTMTVSATFGGSLAFSGDSTFFANGIGQTSVAQGGDGYGGSTTMFIDGGSIVGNASLTMFADGLGGGGQVAGDGYGGDGFAAITGGEGFGDGGTLHVAGDFRVQAGGHGGIGSDNAEGTGGQGGDGYGGSADFYISPDQDSGAIISVQLADAFVTANGEGGAGGNGLTGGNGGGGYGDGYFDGSETFYSGDATTELFAGTVTANQLQVFSTARGGNGGTGSSGVGGNGGDAYAGSSTLTVGGDFNGLALSYDRALAGNGGSGTTQGDGGYASGGYASVDVIEGGHLTGAVDIATNAVGGTGDTGGSADGGWSSLNVEGSLTGSTISIASAATGGDGVIAGGGGSGGYSDLALSGGSVTFSGAALLDASGIAGNASAGIGGFASGGSIDIDVDDGGSLTGGNLTASANATGGNGNFAGGASGGSVDLYADSWDSDVATSMTFDQLVLTANAVLGSGAADESGGFGGYVNVESSGGAITANSLSIEANGTSSGGAIGLQSDVDSNNVGSRLAFGATNAVANGGDSGGFIFVGSGSGSTVDLGDASLHASGGFGGSIYLFAGGCAECGGEGELLAQSPVLSAGGGIAASDLTLDATGSIFVSLSGGADVAVSGTLQGSAGQFISLLDDGTGGAIRAHEIDLSAITIDDSADLVADIINFTTAGGMSLGSLSASDAITLTAGGDLTTADLTAGNTLALNSGGNLQTGDLGATTVQVTATGATSVGDVNAPGSARFTAGGLAAFNGTVSSPTITVTSGDIDVAEGVSLGVSGVTNSLTFNAVGHGQPIVIGDGPAAEGQYHLDEDGDLESAAITINTSSDVQLFDVVIEGSTTSGGGVSHVALNSEGSVFVNGLVDFINAGANDSLDMKAGRNIEVNTDTGGIRITDGADNLAGNLGLTARNVWVGSQSLLSQLEVDPNFTGRAAALAANSGTANPDGFLRAATIHSSVADSFLIQNSGTPELFAGVDTGDGGLSIESTSTTPAAIIAYGRQTNSDGTVITNQDFVGSVDLSGTGGFTDDSAVNGCAIGGTCGEEAPAFTIDMASILGPLNETSGSTDEDKDKDKDKDDQEGDGSKVDPSLRLINTTPINLDHQIDEPVTSGGDVVVGGPGGMN